MSPSLARILDHLAGRADAAVARHLAQHPDVAERAQRLLDAGRRAAKAHVMYLRRLRCA